MSNAPFRVSDLKIITNPDNDSGLDLYDHGDTSNPIVQIDGTANADGLVRVNSTDGALSAQLFNESSRGAFGAYNAGGSTQLNYVGTDTNGGLSKTTATDGTLSTEIKSDSSSRGEVDVYNAAGNTVQSKLAVDNNGGVVQTNADDGTKSVDLTSDSNNRGKATVYNAGGDETRAVMEVDSNDRGSTSTLDANENLSTKITSDTSNRGQLEIYNAAGDTVQSKLAADANGGVIQTKASDGTLSTEEGSDGNKRGFSKLFNAAGDAARYVAEVDSNDQGKLTINDSAGAEAIKATINASRQAAFEMQDAGTSKINLQTKADENSYLNVHKLIVGNSTSKTNAPFEVDYVKSSISAPGSAIYSTGCVIAGGSGHTISGNYNVIAGGILNTISGGDFNFIGGGSGVDIVSGHFASIVGGEDNNITLSDHAFIGGGTSVDVSGSKFSVAVGGFDNDITSGRFSTIGGGSQNSINRAQQAFIGGGGSNEIGSGAAGAAILGGTHNKLGANDEGRNSQSAILAGRANKVSGLYNVVGGGFDNTVSGEACGVFGGRANKVEGFYSTIAGGFFNVVSGNPDRPLDGDGHNHPTGSFIGGGVYNLITGAFSSIISASGSKALADYSFIVGRTGFIPQHHTGAAVFTDGQARVAQSSGQHTALFDYASGVYIANTSSEGTILTLGGGIAGTGADGRITLGSVPYLLSGDVTSASDTNTFLSSASFNTSNGVLTLTKNDASTVTVDLDGRFKTGINSSDVTSALGLTPISGISSSDVTSALGYTPVDPSTTGALVNDNDISSFITGINSSNVTDALGYVPVNPDSTGNFLTGINVTNITGALGLTPISGISSSDVTSALGYTPVDPSTTGALLNDNDITNFITGINATDVTGALGFNPITGVSSSDVTDALGYTPVNPSTTGALVNDNDIANFISGVSASDVTGALGFNPITGVSSSDVTDALGYVPVNPSTTGALVNDNDIANFITGINATDVTGALGFNPITGVSSSDVTSALGYTPVDPSTTGALVNDNDIANFITGINATDVTGALGFNPITGVSSSDVTDALGYTPVDPSTTGALVNDNDIANFISGVSASDVTGALGFNPITGVSSSDVTDALGYTPVDPSTTGALVNDNDIANFITGVSSSSVTDALGFTPLSAESDTLATVTARGNSTTDAIQTTQYVSGATGLFGSRIGIGTTAPSHNLEVTGNIKANSLTIGTDTIYEKSINLHNDGTIRIGNSEMIDKVGNDLELYQGKLNITNGGNVGIGVADPSHKLYVSGEVAGTGAGSRITLNGLPYLLSGDFNDTFTGLSSSNVTNALGYTPVDPSTTGALVNDNDIADFITGINSSNVTSALGYTPVDPSTTGALVNNNDIADFITGVSSSSVTDALGFTPLSAEADTLATVTARGASTTDSITTTQYVSGATGLFQDGIGINTTDISSSLTVSATGDNHAGGYGNNIKLNGSNFPSILFDASSNNDFLLAVDGNGFNIKEAGSDARLTINNDGEVGIGTNNPSKPLHVIGDIKSSSAIVASRAEISSDVRHAGDENTKLSFETDTIHLETNGSKRLTVSSDGNVGIGVLDASHKLYVSGEVAGTGAGSRITLNGLPYLLSGDFNDTFTGLSSSNVTNALGYTPVDPSTTGALVNDNDIANFITGVSSSAVTSALGYTPVDPSTTGALVNGNDIADFITGVSSSNVTDALGFTPLSPESDIEVNEISTSGIILSGDLDFGTSAGRDITFGDNLGAALEFKEGSNLYQRFITTNSSEAIEFSKKVDITNASDLIVDTDTLIVDASNDNVGIGTQANDKYDLQVYSTDMAQVSINANGNNITGAKLRLNEGANYQGGFLHYDASNNIFNIGVHPDNDTDVANDANIISIPRDSTNVGIGTAGPTAKLQVIGDISGYTGLFSQKVGIGTHNPTDILTINQTADSNGIRINGYDDHSSSFVKLFVDNNGRAELSQSTNGADGYFKLEAENYLQLNAGTFVFTDDEFRIYDDGQLSLGNGADFKLKYDDSTDKLKIHSSSNDGITMDTAGNVGIGMANPSELLQTSGGSVAFHGTASGYVKILKERGNTSHYDDVSSSILAINNYYANQEYGLFATNNSNFRIQRSGDDGYVEFGRDDFRLSGIRLVCDLLNQAPTNLAINLRNESSDEVGFYSPATNEIGFVTDRTERMRIDSNGNVGIGVEDPSHKLYVSGEVAGTGAGSRITLNGLPYLLSGDFNDTFTGLSSSNVTSALGYTPVDPSTTGALVNDNDIANFITGINSSNVTDALGYTPVNPGSSPTFDSIYLQNTIYHDGDTDNRIDLATDTISFSTAGTTALTVASNSNIGIGTASPNAAHKLHVEGVSYARSGVIGSSLVGQSPPAEGLIVYGNVGIGTYSAANSLGVYGQANIGASYQSISAPSNGLIVQGDVGVGSSHPAAKLHVSGAIKGGFHISEKSSDFTLAAAENGSFINGTSTSFDQISISSDLGSDFNCSVMHSTSDVDIVASSSMIVNGVTNGTVTLASGYQPASIVRIASNSYAVFGNLI